MSRSGYARLLEAMEGSEGKGTQGPSACTKMRQWCGEPWLFSEPS
jgi:hypothetical protein